MSCQGMPNETGGIHAYAEDIYVHWKVTREIRDGTMVCPQGSLPTTGQWLLGFETNDVSGQQEL